MKNIKIIIGITIAIGLILAFYFVFLKKGEPEYFSVKVIRGYVAQEVSETGNVKVGEKINLSFKNSGKIEKIYVETGGKVEAGKSLARLDTVQLSIQLAEAQASLEVVRAQKKDAQVSLGSARQKLEDTMAIASEKIEKSYTDALSVLDSSYLKMYNAFSFIDLLKGTYFNRGDKESLIISEDKSKINAALNLVKPYIDKAQASSEKEDIDLALIKTKEAFSNTKKALEEARNIIGTSAYKDIVSNTDRNLLDTHKADINTVMSSIVSSQQNISLTQNGNQADINAAESQVLNLESQLKEDEEGLYQTQINQAKIQIDLLANQIWEATMRSPTNGQVAQIQKRAGEMAQSAETVISLIPAAPFQIEVDIYEEDIIIVSVDNRVDITLAALPGEVFGGKVISVDPAEKIIEGVVYYEVTIDFDTSASSVSTLSEVERVEELPSEIKPGMTADIIIKTASRENVLIIPEDAIEKRDSKTTVQVVIGKGVEERSIEIGLRGSDDMVEIISGLKEGEEVIIR